MTVMETQSPPEEKLDFKKVFPIFLILLVDLLGLTIIIPLLALYAAAFGANAFTIGILSASYPLMQFLGAPILGGLSDRYGRKPVLIVSQIGTLIGFLLLGVADTLALLFLARLIDGISGANISTAQAAITDSTTEKTRTQGLGLVGAAFGIGFVIGPVIAFASLAISHENYHVPAFVAAGFSFLSILLTTFWLEETHPAEKRGTGTASAHSRFPLKQMWQALQTPQVGLLLLLLFAQQIAFGGFERLLSLFTLSRLGINASNNAIIFVLIGVIVVMVQGYYIGKWSRRYGDHRLIYAGLGLLALGLILTALTPKVPVNWYDRAELEEDLTVDDANPELQNIKIPLPDESHKGWLGISWLLLAMVPAAVGGGILQPSINSQITKRVDPDEIGSILGVSASFFSGANVVAPLLGGAVFEAIGVSAPFLLGGIILLVLFGVALQRVKPTGEVAQGDGVKSANDHQPSPAAK